MVCAHVLGWCKEVALPQVLPSNVDIRNLHTTWVASGEIALYSVEEYSP